MDLERAAKIVKDAVIRLFGYYVKRPIQRFNIQNRAEKVIKTIEEEKPKAAPRHPGTQQQIQQFISEHPEIKQKIDEKPDDLLSRLKSVKVVSKERSDDDIKLAEERQMKFKDKLPQSRTMMGYEAFGYVEPENVPKGKVTLTRATEFIMNHAKEPLKHNKEIIAEQYRLQNRDVENVLNYFKPFHFHNPTEKKYDKNRYIDIFASDRISYLIKRENKENEESEKSEDKDNANTEDVKTKELKDSKTDNTKK